MAGRRKVEVFKENGKRGKWHWRLLSATGIVLGDSGQGYVRRGYAEKRAAELNPGVKVEVVE